MISRYSHQGIAWVDLESPTRDEVEKLADEYGLHPVVQAELLSDSERAKVDLYDGAIYLILHFPVRNKKTGHVSEAEIDFILKKEALITTHYELIDPLHDFSRLFDTGSYLTSTKIGEHAGFLFFAQIRELYKHTLFLIESVGHEIKDIEKHIFAGEEAEMVGRISKTNRALIDIKQSLRYHKEILKSFTTACKRLYGDDFIYYVGLVEGEYEHIEKAIDEERQTLRDLRETNDSLLSTKTNDTIKRLTVVNVILLPLGLISWIFAMNSKYLSLDDPTSLLVVFGGMFVIGLSNIIYFKMKKWL